MVLSYDVGKMGVQVENLHKYRLGLKSLVGIFAILISFLLIQLISFTPSFELNSSLGVIVLLYASIKLIGVSSNIPAFIVSLIVLFYFISTFIPYTLGYQISPYEAFQESYYIGKSMYLYILFVFIFFLFLKRSKPIVNKEFYLLSNSAIFPVALIWILLLLLTIYGKGGETIFAGGGYNNSNSVGQTFYEYFSFFLVMIFLLYRKKKSFYFLIPVISLYIIKALLYGARVEVVEVVLVVIFFWWGNNIKVKFLLPIILLGYVASEVFAVIRVYPNFLNLDLETVKEIFFPSDERAKVLFSNAGDVFYASNRIISLSDIELITSEVKFKSFTTLFLPFNFFSNSDLASFMVDQYKAGGGGLIFGYFYVWLGIFGVFISAMFLSIIVNSYSWKTPPIYSIMVFPYVIRWFAYNPVTLLKHGIMCSVFIYLLLQFYKLNRTVVKKAW